MTRCDAYWDKVRKLLAEDDKESLVEFCDKNDITISRIVDHVQYIDKLVEKSTEMPIGKPDDLSKIESLPEGATRPLRTLYRMDPMLHDKVLVEVAKLDEPTSKNITELIVSMSMPTTPPTPEGKYDIIVVDPPWPLTGSDEHYMTALDRSDIYVRMHTRPYPRMPLEEIAALKIPAADTCILWLWTTNMNLHNAFHVLERWGFVYRSCLTWVKPIMGLGYWLRGKTEHCLLATKGSPIWTNKNETTAIYADRREDSRKPDVFYDMVDRICKGRKLDMFSREKRDGWDQWGDDPDRF